MDIESTVRVAGVSRVSAGVDAAGLVGAASRRTQTQTVRIDGRFDVRSVGHLRFSLHSAIDCGTGTLRVDVGGLELADDAGLGVLLGGALRARRRGRSMVLVNVPAALGALLDEHRLSRMLRVEEEAPELVHVGHA